MRLHKMEFWRWVKNLAQRQLGETPDTLQWYGREIRIDEFGHILMLLQGSPEPTWYVIARL